MVLGYVHCRRLALLCMSSVSEVNDIFGALSPLVDAFQHRVLFNTAVLAHLIVPSIVTVGCSVIGSIRK